MSEAEKRRRLYYKQNRNKWLRLGSLILAGAILITMIFAVMFFSFNKDTYIGYVESGDVNYSVYLKQNDIFGDTVVGEDNMYVASLIDKVQMRFAYDLKMEQAAKYSYTYSADALIVIKDKSTKKLIYQGKLSPETPELLPETTVELEEPKQNLSVKKTVLVDYEAYNDRAKAILSALSLKDVACTLEVTMKIDIKGSVENAEQGKENAYSFALSMPLNADKVSFTENSAVPDGESKLLTVNDGAERIVFLIITIVLFVLTLLYAGVYVALIFLTRNTDINYNIKVNKVVSNYKSYIQKIINPFDRTGYQLLVVDTFTELLEIRDTIQSPILMNENEDKTCTSFMIPTNTKLLYLFEIKVADYDEIYKKIEEGEETPITTDELPEIIYENEENAEGAENANNAENANGANGAENAENANDTELVLLEKVDEEELAVAIAVPDVPLSEIEYDEDDDSDDEEEGVEVIGVVWPTQKKHNKVYRYDPNGERVTKGDIVLVPSRDAAQNKEVVRKATVAHGNHKVEPENLSGPLKKIIGVFRRKAEEALMPKAELIAKETAAMEAAKAALAAAEEAAKAPAEAVETPVETVEALAETAETPVEAVEAPVTTYENEEVATAEAIPEEEEAAAAEETPENTAEAAQEEEKAEEPAIN